MAELDKMMEQARANLTKKREEIQAKIEALETELSDISREFNAIDAYEKARTGKTTKARGKRTTGRKQQVLDLLAKKGMGRADILSALDAKGNKSAEQSITNTLSSLKKAGKLTLTDGVYTVA